MKKIFIIIFSLILVITANSSAQGNKYSKVKVSINSLADFDKLFKSGIDLEGAINIKNPDRAEIFVTEDEKKILNDLGLKFDVLIEDWIEYYNALPKPTPAEVIQLKEKYGITGGFGYGSMGGNYTFNEIVSKLDTMSLLYPNLISQKVSIGTTTEGRNQWMVKITKDPELPNNRPQVLYTALTHSREPQGMMTVLYYMFYLLEKYGTDPEVTYLVNNREIYFLPCISADGYEYNRQTNPTGGGNWRKNRRNNGGGTYGVDLNRNFGPYEYWNAPNGGSSTSPSSDTYRGTAPFSEPETENYKNFVQSKRIVACLNYHTYSNLLVYPYGALGTETPDSAIFREFARDMTAWNGYTYGTDLQTVNYSTRGNSDDWLYSGDPVTTRPKCFGMTPEVGASGFWPTSNEIFPLAIENLKPNLYYTWIAGGYPSITNKKFVKPTDFILPGQTIKMELAIKNKGLQPTNNLSIEFTSLSGSITLDSNSIINIDPIESRTEIQLSQKPLVFSIASGAINGSKHKILMKLKMSNIELVKDTIDILVGAPSVVFTDNFDSGISGWTNGTPAWGTTQSNPHSPTYSVTESPSGNYGSSVNTSFTKTTPFDLTNSSQAYLEFWSRWDIEAKYDWGQVQISSNGGSTWISMKGKYTKPASGNSPQVLGTFGYDGTQLSWVMETIDLTQFLGKSNLKLRFLFQSDAGVQRDGWYIDDVRILSFQVSQQQTASFNTNDGWNIVSVPVQLNDGRKEVVFPNSTSSAFIYNNGYIAKDTLINGSGYWLKFNQAQVHNLSGVVINPMVIPVSEGWNMIGSTFGDIPVSSIIVTPNGILQSSFYEYNNGYNQVSTISKGKGFWVKSSSNGLLTLNSTSFKNAENVRKSDNTSYIEIKDASNQICKLYISEQFINNEEIPPVPPAGILDVRYDNNTNIQNVTTGKVININNALYPVTLKLVSNQNLALKLEDLLDGNQVNSVLGKGNKLELTLPGLNKIKISETSVPTDFSLYQNFPNPFNPSTNIQFSLAEKGKVSLIVYSLLGEVVEKLVDSELETGIHSVIWNAANVTSGVYFYELKVGSANGNDIRYSSKRKMVLIK